MVQPALVRRFGFEVGLVGRVHAVVARAHEHDKVAFLEVCEIVAEIRENRFHVVAARRTVAREHGEVAFLVHAALEEVAARFDVLACAHAVHARGALTVRDFARQVAGGFLDGLVGVVPRAFELPPELPSKPSKGKL